MLKPCRDIQRPGDFECLLNLLLQRQFRPLAPVLLSQGSLLSGIPPAYLGAYQRRLGLGGGQLLAALVAHEGVWAHELGVVGVGVEGIVCHDLNRGQQVNQRSHLARGQNGAGR